MTDGDALAMIMTTRNHLRQAAEAMTQLNDAGFIEELPWEWEFTASFEVLQEGRDKLVAHTDERTGPHSRRIAPQPDSPPPNRRAPRIDRRRKDLGRVSRND